MIRRYGEAVKSGMQYRRRPGVYAVLLRGDQVLLTHQAEPIPEFQLPGGGIDPGEAPIAALHREVYEETGWHISSPKLVGIYRRFTYMPEYDKWAEKVCAIYVARPTLCMGPPSEAGHTAIWTEAGSALALLTNQGDRAMAARVLRG
ncbi:NUDIX domain-containing protein [Stagnihabitans tardus]|uniref:NUDIX domain-containing protein n=1 Tax=Stagnihabitans tardus TaxID=2699202 RepID=A0AAE4Y8E5_9RHOB|nr:NUDIX hydrolase [Stagnihabitans tardus]NBZ86831.1 NUDIX domain-containing protein [Stagnihabitans tardus]